MRAAASPALLEVRGLRVSFRTDRGVVRAVDGVDFDLRAGEVLALVGESGSGKTATALALLGLNRGPNAEIDGSARIGGAELIGAPEEELRRVRGGQVGFVFQDAMTAFNPVYRVGAQIVEAIRAHRPESGREEARARAVELLDAVGIPDPERAADAYPHELSGGMRQRALIAMALAPEPEALIADEPTTALDVTVQAQILRLLARLNRERQLATLLITHDLGVVAETADRVAVMRDGRVVEAGLVEEVFRRPRDPYTRALLAAVPRLDRPLARRARARGDGPLLEVEGLVKHFPLRAGALGGREAGRVRAVDGIGLRIGAGEALGLVGESGSGKTTACRAILRLVEPDAGSIRFDGVELTALPQRRLRALRAQMQMVFQDPWSSLNPRHRVGRIVAAPLRVHGVASGRELRRRVDELLETVGLSPADRDRFPHEFSGGQRQRIGIARALALRPRLVVCDEPVSALDVSIQAQIVALLGELRERLGLAYLFVAHDIAVVREVCDRIAVMRAGRMVEEGEAERVCAAPREEYTQRLIASVPVPEPRAGRAGPV